MSKTGGGIEQVLMGVGRRIAVGCCAVLLMSGCAGSPTGVPVASRPDPSIAPTADQPRQPFDPCTIPESAVTASGLLVETMRPDFGGITKKPGWKLCTWDGPSANPWYFLAVQSTMNSVEEYLRSPQNERQLSIEIGPRRATQYHVAYQGDPPDGCDIALAAGENLVIFQLETIGSEETLGDPCVAVADHARDFEKYLPG